MKYKPERLREILAEHIENSPLYDPDPEKIKIIQRSHKTIIRYSSARDPESLTQTQFKIRIQNNITTIDWIERDETRRKKGLGRQLYLLLEQFLLDEGCTAIELVASNERKSRFWKSLGFSGTNPYILSKKLS